MSTSQKLTADILLVVQLGLGFIFAGSRITRVQETLQGVLLSEFILIQVFALLGLGLAVAANRAAPSRIAKQGVGIYAFWTVMLALCIGSTLISRAGHYAWSMTDTVTIVSGALGALVVIVIGRICKLTLRDPMVRAWIALVLKGWPQLALGYKILEQGSAGLPLLALVLGHLTILIRLVQIGMSIRLAGWDRNRRGLFLSEAGNELTWLATTAAWIIS